MRDTVVSCLYSDDGVADWFFWGDNGRDCGGGGGSTQVFDVDQAVVLRVKNGLLERAGAIEMNEKERQQGAARARIVTVEADLRQAGWEGELFEAGFDPALPSAWILEGLTM